MQNRKKRLPGEVAMTRSKPKEESLPDTETTDSGGQWQRTAECVQGH